MKDLFTPLTRDERQKESVRKWLKAKGKATIVAGTGFGKTRVAIKCITLVRQKYPNLSVLVVVPTQLLKDQWIEELDKWGLSFNTDVKVMMGASKQQCQYDMLVIDEAHRVNSEVLSNILINVKYKLILGLTATFERLDGRHEILAKHAPVCDTITLEVAKLNGWISNYSEYQVIISPKDIDIYRHYNKEFIANFEFFNFNYPLAMSLLGKTGFKNKIKLRDELCRNNPNANPSDVLNQINYHSTAFMRSLQNRKKFIYNHPQKIEVAREIIKYRSDKKLSRFLQTLKWLKVLGLVICILVKKVKRKIELL